MFGSLEVLATGNQPIVIETDAALAPVPLGLLFPGRNVVRSFSQAEFRKRATAGGFPRRARALAVANPTLFSPFREAFPYMADSHREAADFAEAYPWGRTVANESATPGALAGAAPGTQLFHYSGHATVTGGSGALMLASPNPEQPFAGMVTADAVAGQDWSECELAVLSACSTGREPFAPTQPDSLAHAFLTAGARRTIASLWNVDAGATRALMKAFYQNLSRGAQPGQALLEARQSLSSDPRTRHPYYWAAFQIFGSY